jgi:alpha-galactosidase
MTNEEYRTHMSLWALLAAPLLAGNDLERMSKETVEVLANRDVIAVDQDPATRPIKCTIIKKASKRSGDARWQTDRS